MVHTYTLSALQLLKQKKPFRGTIERELVSFLCTRRVSRVRVKGNRDSFYLLQAISWLSLNRNATPRESCSRVIIRDIYYIYYVFRVRITYLVSYKGKCQPWQSGCTQDVTLLSDCPSPCEFWILLLSNSATSRFKWTTALLTEIRTVVVWTKHIAWGRSQCSNPACAALRDWSPGAESEGPWARRKSFQNLFHFKSTSASSKSIYSLWLNLLNNHQAKAHCRYLQQLPGTNSAHYQAHVNLLHFTPFCLLLITCNIPPRELNKVYNHEINRNHCCLLKAECTAYI